MASIPINTENDGSQNEDFCDESLPDTLPIESTDCLQSQSHLSADLTELIAWGKLIPYDNSESSDKKLPTINLTRDKYTAGRSLNMDIQFNLDNTEETDLQRISKTHFIIKREKISKKNSIVVIYDQSRNGILINKQKINGKCVLMHQDIIGCPKSVYSYIQLSHLSIDIPDELSKNYIALTVLGSGICGPVKLIYSKQYFCPLALKCIAKRGISVKANQEFLENPKKIMNEVEILKALKHPYIIKMVNFINAPLNIFIMLEVMEGGDLFDRIKLSHGLPEQVAKFHFYQIALAVEYLHSKGVTHRDLKPENILMLNDDEYTIVKVTDFGMSKLVNQETMMKTFCGTPYYVAPEILKTMKIHRSCSYTSQVDVWSLGVILYIMLSSYVPFSKDANANLHDVIMEGKYYYPPEKFNSVSRSLKHLISTMLTVDPNERGKISDVVKSFWLSDDSMITKVRQITLSYEEKNKNQDENKIPNTNSDNFSGGNGKRPRYQ